MENLKLFSVKPIGYVNRTLPSFFFTFANSEKEAINKIENRLNLKLYNETIANKINNDELNDIIITTDKFY